MTDHETTFSIAVTRTRQGVNLGDHAQDITDALDVPPDMTVGQLVSLGLTQRTWNGLQGPAEPDTFITIRIAQQLVPHVEPTDIDPDDTPF